jgi:uncharacterized protein
MHTRKLHAAAVAALWFALSLPALAVADASPTTDQLLAPFPRATLTIATPDARQHRFKVWVAHDEARRERGLMFVRTLADDAGMLFIYDEPQKLSMWMKNTFIPLDMLFIGSDGRVSQVAADTTPQSLKVIESTVAGTSVLELKAGTAKKLGITAGAIVTWTAAH